MIRQDIIYFAKRRNNAFGDSVYVTKISKKVLHRIDTCAIVVSISSNRSEIN